MLYGKNPWYGITSHQELFERIKKDIKFPEQPFVTPKTKEMIRSALRVREEERVGWEVLFEHFLYNSPLTLSSSMQQQPQQLLEEETLAFYENTYFMEGPWELLGVMTEAGLKVNPE